MQRLRPCRNIDDDADKLGSPKKSGLEQYAPPARRAQVNDADRAVANTVEGEIREFVWRDHQQRSKADAVNELIRRVAGSSAEEIDQVIRELQRVRDMLHGEGERPLWQLKPMERRFREPRAVDGGIQGAGAWR